MVRSNKGSFAKSNNEPIQIIIARLETVTLWHQANIDRTRMNLSMMLKRYSREKMHKTDLEQEGEREWLRQNSSISELEIDIISEIKEFDAAVEEYNSRPTPKFYELWKKEIRAREDFQMFKWRKRIRSMHSKLVKEKENSLATPLAKQFINSYVEEKIAEQSDNQKRVIEIHFKRDTLSEQKNKIANISAIASQINIVIKKLR